MIPPFSSLHSVIPPFRDPFILQSPESAFHDILSLHSDSMVAFYCLFVVSWIILLLGFLAVPPDDQHPALTSPKNSSIASVAPSFHSFLTAGALGIFPPAVFAHSSPEPPDLGRPGPALDEEMIPRLPLAAAAPLALA